MPSKMISMTHNSATTSDGVNQNSGIYAIRCMLSDRMYIGHSVNVINRWSQHRSQLRRDVHFNPHLQNAWNKYGEEAFEFVVLEKCPIEALLDREQYYISTTPSHYNISKFAGTCLGITRTLETRAKMSEAQKGRKHSPETRAKISAARAGRTAGPETRAKISESLRGHERTVGYKHTPEAKANMSAALVGNTNSRGHKRTLETKAKMSAAQMGNRNATGIVHTPEARANMSAAQIGRKHTPETKAKMSAARKAYWERRRAEEAASITVDP
jgi:hypothetical protein